jgi:hypothetical protein
MYLVQERFDHDCFVPACPQEHIKPQSTQSVTLPPHSASSTVNMDPSSSRGHDTQILYYACTKTHVKVAGRFKHAFYDTEVVITTDVQPVYGESISHLFRYTEFMLSLDVIAFLGMPSQNVLIIEPHWLLTTDEARKSFLFSL